MLKAKIIVISLFAVFAIFSIVLFGFYKNSNEVTSSKDISYTSIVLQEQSFYAFIPEKNYKKKFTLFDQKGNKINPTFEWRDDSILKITSLANGIYTLTVPKNNAKEEIIQFEVKYLPEQVQNKQQLQDYFLSVKELKAVLAAAFSVNDEGFFKSFLGQFEQFSVTEESATDTSSASESVTGSNYSHTNNQVTGIEEGDIAVTNGDYIFTARDTEVMIVKPEPLEQVGKLSMSNNMYIEKLFTYNNSLIVQYVDYDSSIIKTAVQIYDVKNPNSPKLIHTFSQEGYSMESRIFNDQLYLLSNYSVTKENDIVPKVSANGEDKFIEERDIMIYPYTMSEDYTVLSKLNLTNFDTSTKAFLGAGSNLYMSENAIYVAASMWEPQPFTTVIEPIDSSIPTFNEADETTIIKYTVDKEIKKVAETKIKGTLLNQFSMDEYDGYFRVATTVGNANLNDKERNSENLLYVLDDDLSEVGKVSGLARGERIYSVRFMEDKAYIVTFVETDPLFVLDLKDPANPIVQGELKIPGYSNYLHPIHKHHLLGIGHDTVVRNDGKQKFVENLGIKLSLFNVTDPTNPIEQDVEILGGAGTTSSINHSHKGLYRDVSNNYYGFDITVYNNYAYEGTGAVFFEITPNGIDRRKLLIEKSDGEQYEDWNEMVKRILYINDKTFIIYNSEIKSISRSTLEELETITIQ